MARLDWPFAIDSLATCPDPRSLRRRLLSIGDALGPELLGMGVSPGAWRSLGVIVVAADLKGMSGSCDVGDPRRVILVNRDEASVRQRFTVAHEMAHLLMARVDRRAIGLSSAAEEQLCNEYAQRMLVPTADLWDFLPRLGSDVEAVLQICTRYGVSLSVALNVTGEWFADRGVIFLAASDRGHPDRPDEVALRAYKARCGPFLVPANVRLSSFGLDDVASRLDACHPRAAGNAPEVALRLWRPLGSPRSGTACGPAGWRARRLRTGLVVLRVDVERLERRWSEPRARREPAAMAA